MCGWGWSGSRLVAEYGSGGIVRRWLPGPGTESVAYVDGSGANPRFVATDERGSVVADYDKASIQTYRYGPHGEPDSGGSPDRLGYAGGIDVAELGLVLMGSRVYSPAMGRFLQTDPIGIAGGANVYDYTGGDPVNGVDPSGLETVEIVGRPICGSGANCYSGADALRLFETLVRDEDTDRTAFLNERDRGRDGPDNAPAIADERKALKEMIRKGQRSILRLKLLTCVGETLLGTIDAFSAKNYENVFTTLAPPVAEASVAAQTAVFPVGRFLFYRLSGVAVRVGLGANALIGAVKGARGSYACRSL